MLLRLCFGENQASTIRKRHKNRLYIAYKKLRSFDSELLTIKGFMFEIKNNSAKAKTGINVSKKLSYSRMTNIEGNDSNMAVLNSKKEPLRNIAYFKLILCVFNNSRLNKLFETNHGGRVV